MRVRTCMQLTMTTSLNSDCYCGATTVPGIMHDAPVDYSSTYASNSLVLPSVYLELEDHTITVINITWHDSIRMYTVCTAPPSFKCTRCVLRLKRCCIMAWSHFSVSKCSVQLARGDRALSELITAWLCRSIDINLADMCTVKIKACRVWRPACLRRGDSWSRANCLLCALLCELTYSSRVWRDMTWLRNSPSTTASRPPHSGTRCWVKVTIGGCSARCRCCFKRVRIMSCWH